MTHRALSLIIGLLVLASAALVAIDQGSTGAASPAPSPASPVPSPASSAAPPASLSDRAGDRYKNVQVLKDISFSELNATMHFGGMLTVAYATPVAGGDDRQYDSEVRIVYNLLFGPQNRFTRAQF